MRHAVFKGSGVALVTPFDDDGVNESVLRELVEFQVTGGSEALVMCGSTGEAATMSAAEHARTIEIAADAVAGRIPLVAGVGGSDTAAVSALARTARSAGADALLASPPPYNKPTQRGIVAHFRAILDAADLPMIIYNIPGRTACNVLPETIEELASDPRVVGVKEASGDMSQIVDLAHRLGDRLAIYSGNDDQVLPILALGGAGIISVLANVAPGDVSRIVQHFLAGELEEARQLQFRYLPLVRTLFREPNPVAIKAAVNLLGFDTGPVRLPLTPLLDDTMQQLLADLQAAGIPTGTAV